MPFADGVVGVLNARAVTVYLWHEIALIASIPLIDLMWNVPAFEAHLPLDAVWFQYLLTWPLIAVAILLVGWAEDLAARRVPHPWPTGNTARKDHVDAGHEAAATHAEPAHKRDGPALHRLLR
jgi:hypothetical protein